MHGLTVTGAASEVDADVVVETAHPDVVFDNLKTWREKGFAVVVGTSGFTPGALWISFEISGEPKAPLHSSSPTSRSGRCS